MNQIDINLAEISDFVINYNQGTQITMIPYQNQFALVIGSEEFISNTYGLTMDLDLILIKSIIL